ncbi:MAG: RnfABCDGE type electron transport complex subunit D [Spirochaetales bacterium]|jgi:electron transport complex protein RnfD|nr:RnfABCDGE type electron transport complex subunit D [Spirochaetota bacterium]NLL23897.1 RnfABCDGE type electron transport complex subunit D [Spirochaetales bacterium]
MMTEQPLMTVSSSPHLHDGSSTANIMWHVSLSLVPAALWGIYVFGLYSLVIILVSIVSAALTEFLLGKIGKECTIWDGSAVLTGFLVGLNMPPSIPLFIPIVASFFAIFVAKWTFGGLGANWANPALSGRVFVFFSFTTQMSTFTTPRTLLEAMPDTLSGATPLGFMKTAVSGGSCGATTNELLSWVGYPATPIAQKIGAVLGINAYTIDTFLGNVAGSIGEVSALLLLIGGIYLLIRRIITWHIPVTYLLSSALLSRVFGGLPLGLGIFQGTFFPSMFSGGLLFGALFMATDYVTSPVSSKGKIIFGIGCGFFTFLFRSFGSMPEAVSVSILLMNIITPTIDRYIRPRKFGEKKLFARKEAVA